MGLPSAPQRARFQSLTSGCPSLCRGRDLNPYPLNRGLGPQPSASADSATSARTLIFVRKNYTGCRDDCQESDPAPARATLSAQASAHAPFHGTVTRKLSNFALPSAKAYGPTRPVPSWVSLALRICTPSIRAVSWLPFAVSVRRYQTPGL